MDTKSITGLRREVGDELIERGGAEIPDLKGGGVTIIWGDMPDKMRKEGWFELKKGKNRMVLNKHQLQYLLRNV